MQIQVWREMLEPYMLVVDELVVKFNHIINEYQYAGKYSPIEQVNGRVKKIASILEKAQRKGIELDEIEEKIDDIAGIRIICQFVEDIDKVVEIIEKRQDMRIRQKKDYISKSKESGYRSYHVIVEYEIQTIEGPKLVKAEIQIRTLAMNFWATVEHSLQYKYKDNMPEHVKKRLLKSAEAIVSLDSEMSLVRNEIMDAQSYHTKKAAIVSDILTSIKNLYKVASKREVDKIQDEFFVVYNTGDLAKLSHFNQELDIIVEGYKAQSLF